jgi:hypothetical protein
MEPGEALGIAAQIAVALAGFAGRGRGLSARSRSRMVQFAQMILLLPE